MSPQAVDFNGDGHLDLVAGTYDGSPHVAYGSPQGFAQPVHILDKEGKRILHNQYWSNNKRKWIYGDRKNPGHFTSAWAWDWDRDGDLDLLLGDHRGGGVYLRRNEGRPGHPAFATNNEPVRAGPRGIRYTDKVATVRTLDYNGDGRDDLLVGTMGNAYTSKSVGALWVHLDTRGEGEPAFAPGVKVVEGSPGRPGELVGPAAGFYFNVTDYDGDGDLDLLVGGKAVLLPQARPLTPEEKGRLKLLASQSRTINKAISKVMSKIYAEAGDRKDKEWMARYRAARAKYQKSLTPLQRANRKLQAARNKLQPRRQALNRVWL